MSAAPDYDAAEMPPILTCYAEGHVWQSRYVSERGIELVGCDRCDLLEVRPKAAA